MAELGIDDKLVWRTTSMGYFIDGRHYTLGRSAGAADVPQARPDRKLRYGLHMFLSTRRSDWSPLETRRTPGTGFVKWRGAAAYEVLWRRLFDLKFFEYADDISAAWIWTRIKRVGTSRTSRVPGAARLHRWRFGGADHALVQAIEGGGGILRLGARVSQITSEAGRVTGVRRRRRTARLRRRDFDRADALRLARSCRGCPIGQGAIRLPSATSASSACCSSWPSRSRGTSG